jgi:hypothetical protein
MDNGTEKLSADERALLNCLPPDGSTRGNQAVRQQLGWDEDRYFDARDVLEDEGYLLRGQGRGGTVRRVLTRGEPVVTVTTSLAAAASDIE